MGTYNSWTNWETWNVQTHYDFESAEEVEAAKESLEEQRDDMPEGPAKDAVTMFIIEVNWRELEEAAEEE